MRAGVQDRDQNESRVRRAYRYSMAKVGEADEGERCGREENNVSAGIGRRKVCDTTHLARAFGQQRTEGPVSKSALRLVAVRLGRLLEGRGGGLAGPKR